MLVIREARKSDAAAISGLISQLAEHLNEESPVTEAAVLHFLAFPGSGILVAEESDRLAGCLSFSLRPGLYHAAPSCVIEDLVVDRNRRRHGIGESLLEAIVRRARAEGCAEISVTVMPDNHGALSLYRAHGLVDEAVFLEMHF